jgi:hypothetical protein
MRCSYQDIALGNLFELIFERSERIRLAKAGIYLLTKVLSLVTKANVIVGMN